MPGRAEITSNARSRHLWNTACLPPSGVQRWRTCVYSGSSMRHCAHSGHWRSELGSIVDARSSACSVQRRRRTRPSTNPPSPPPIASSENHGKKIAVIENEYGEIGIDDALVMESKEEVRVCSAAARFAVAPAFALPFIRLRLSDCPKTVHSQQIFEMNNGCICCTGERTERADALSTAPSPPAASRQPNPPLVTHHQPHPTPPPQSAATSSASSTSSCAAATSLTTSSSRPPASPTRRP